MSQSLTIESSTIYVTAPCIHYHVSLMRQYLYTSCNIMEFFTKSVIQVISAMVGSFLCVRFSLTINGVSMCQDLVLLERDSVCVRFSFTRNGCGK